MNAKSNPETTRRKRVDLNYSSENTETNSDLPSVLESFQKLCDHLKSEEELLVMQTFCHDYIEKLLQQRNEELEALSDELDQEFERHVENDHVNDQDENSDEEDDTSPNDDEQIKNAHLAIKSNLKTLQSIKHFIREKLPNTNAYAPNERFYFPGEVSTSVENRQFDGYTRSNTIHMDGFLYDNDEMNELFRRGEVPQFYCEKCNSSSHIKEMNIISHSFSLDELAFIFSSNCMNKDFWIRNRILEKIKLSLGITNLKAQKDDYKLLTRKNMKDHGIVLMDVGSRLGSVLYYVYLFIDPLSVKQLIGVEINEFFAKLQQETVTKFKMGEKIKILNSDIMQEQDLVKQCDILVMHNVFEWFFSQKENQEIWKRLKTEFLTRKGLRLITCPSIQQSLDDAALTDVLSIDGWLKEIPLNYPDDETTGEKLYTEIHMYEVL
ncbi:hypothetical protein FDP41_010663 [Naegleria fowleri]|uniref:Methyltransferase type 11 domain-containing protein n=1 Tax=Naegleria fowleri TaxID=5763 RepID=A0A6A5CDL1_NAEFO|nr:uncharacterized protein FDP41_010663 [Naegleria fowleri]KAF0983598.1 hypothetical protein FDP41_010663 [Naegleria fowleri]